MAKPVTSFTTFGSSTSGTTTQLDNNFLTLKNAVNDLNTYANFLTDTGSANAIVVTLAANLTGPLTNGLVIQVKIAATNTTATTLNYNSGGTLNVLNVDGTALVAGQLIVSGIVQFQYRASDTVWLLQTPALVPSVAASGGGSMVLLATKQANANTTIDFNNMFSSTYDQYRLTIAGYVPAGNGSFVGVRVGTGNTPTYQTTNYAWTAFHTGTSATSDILGSVANGPANMVVVSGAAGTGLYSGANAVYTAEISLSGGNFNAPMTVKFSDEYMAAVGYQPLSGSGGGFWNSNTIVTSVQVIPSNANITSGNFALYGIKKA